MIEISENYSKQVYGGYYCSKCPRNPDGSMKWIDDAYIPNHKVTAALILGAAITGAISGAKGGPLGMIAGSLLAASSAAIARLFYDGAMLKENEY